MSKQTKTTAAKSGNTTSTTNRADRWRMIAENRVANLRNDHALVLGAMASVNALDPVEYVVSNLRRERGLDTDAPDLLQQEHIKVDGYYDNAPSRTRTAHDTDIVTDFILLNTLTPCNLTAEETVALVRRHGRKGDGCLRAVIDRVIRAAIAA